MRVYRSLKVFAAVVLSGYFTGGLAAHHLPGHEVYPVFSWFLFTHVPGRSMWFTIRLHTVGERTFDPPLYFHQAKGVVEEPASVTAQYVINQMGRWKSLGIRGKTAAYRKLLEEDFLPPNTDYDVLRVTFHPLDRWRTGEEKRAIIARYSSRKEKEP